MRSRRLLLIFALLLTFTASWAQRRTSFLHYETGNTSIFSAFKSKDGIMWLGTSRGLMTSAQIQSSPDKFYHINPALENIITEIQEDNTGRLWLRTQANKYLVYTPQTNELVTDLEAYLSQLGMPLKYDLRASIDHKGAVWFFKDNGLYVHDFKTGSSKRTLIDKKNGQIIAVCFDNDEAFIFTEHKILTMPVTGKSMKTRLFADTPEPLNYDRTFFVHAKTGEYWMSGNDKLFLFDTATRKWKHQLPGVKGIISLVKYQDRHVIAATTNNGIYVFEHDKLYMHEEQRAPMRAGLLNNHIQTVNDISGTNMMLVAYHKQDISIWTDEDITMQVHSIQVPERKFAMEDVISLAAADNHSVWVGTEDNGIFRVSLDHGNDVIESRFSGKTVTSVHQDSDGKIWAGIYRGGLTCTDGRHFFEGMSPYGIIETAPDRFFLNMVGNGLWVLNPKTGAQQHIETDNPWIMQIERCGNHIYGASPTYLYKIDVRTLKVDAIDLSIFKGQSFAHGNKALLGDSRGWLWCVSYKDNTAVDVYNTKTGKTFRINELSKYIIKGIAEDAQGQIWCTTDQGILRVKVINGKSPRFELYCFTNRESVLYNERTIECIDGRTIVAGAVNGFQVFDAPTLCNIQASQSKLQKVVPGNGMRLIVSSLSVNGNLISPGAEYNGRVIVSNNLAYMKHLELKYDENNIVLNIGQDVVNQSSNTGYAYMIEGLQDNWQPLEHYTLALSNIPAGDYRVMIKLVSSNADISEPYELLTITVTPPFWFSTWAYILYILIGVSTLLMGYIYYSQKLQSRMKMRFFTSISHDLRTPLTLIITPVEELLNTVTDKDVNSTLQIVHNNAKRLYSLVNQILDFRTLEDGKTVQHEFFGDVVAFVRDQVNTFSPLSQANDIQLTFTSDKPSLGIMFNRDTLGKIIDNILGNAFKYTPEGGNITVTLSASLPLRERGESPATVPDAFASGPSPSGTLTLEIADTGSGIPDSEKEHIFDRYYMSENGTRKAASNGIGLSIVKQCIDNLHGTITVRDNYIPAATDPATTIKRGTVFVVKLPITATAPGSVPGSVPGSAPGSVPGGIAAGLTPATVPDASASGSITPPCEGQASPHTLPLIKTDKTVLIVEDNPDLLTFISQQLSREYNVCQTTNGIEALEVLRNTDVDVIISDVMMDGIDGLELCRRVRSNITTSHIPLILLTAKALDSDQMQGLQLGADDYVTKPFNFDILRLRIRKLIQRTEQGHRAIEQQPDIKPSDVTVTTLDEQFLADVLRVIEDNMSNADFSVDDLSDAIGMHRTAMYKKMQSVTGKTPLQFIRLMKMKRAHQLMSRGNVLVSQVAYEVGFNQPRKFAQYFKEQYGVTPSEFLKNAESTNTDKEE